MGLPVHGAFTFYSPATESREKSLFRYKSGTHMIDYTARTGESWPGSTTVYGNMPFYPVSAIDRYGEQNDYDETGINIWKKDPYRAKEVIHPVSQSFASGKKHYGYGVFGSYLMIKRSKGTGARTIYVSVRNENYMNLSYVSHGAEYDIQDTISGEWKHCVDVVLNITGMTKALSQGKYSDGHFANASVALTLDATLDPVLPGLKYPEIDNAIGRSENGTYSNGRIKLLDVLEDDQIRERSGEIISKSGNQITIRAQMGYQANPYFDFWPGNIPKIIGAGIRSTSFKIMFLGHMKYIETLNGDQNAIRGISDSVLDSQGLLLNPSKTSQILTTRDSQLHPHDLGVTSHMYYSVPESEIVSGSDGTTGLIINPTTGLYPTNILNDGYARTSISYSGRSRFATIPFGGNDDGYDPADKTKLGDHDCYLIAVQARRLGGTHLSVVKDVINPETYNFDSGFQIIMREGA